VQDIKSLVIKKGSIKEDEWQAIVKNFVADSS
jgi:hypothetical protein